MLTEHCNYWEPALHHHLLPPLYLYAAPHCLTPAQAPSLFMCTWRLHKQNATGVLHAQLNLLNTVIVTALLFRNTDDPMKCCDPKKHKCHNLSEFTMNFTENIPHCTPYCCFMFLIIVQDYSILSKLIYRKLLTNGECLKRHSASLKHHRKRLCL